MKLTSRNILSILLSYGKELCPLANLTGPCNECWFIQYGTGPLAMAYGHFVKMEDITSWRSLHDAMDALYSNWLEIFKNNTLPFSYAYCQGRGPSPLQQYWNIGTQKSVPVEILAIKQSIRYQLGIILVGNTDQKLDSQEAADGARVEIKRLIQALLDLMRIRREEKLTRIRKLEENEKPAHFLVFQQLKMLLQEEGVYAQEEVAEQGGMRTLFYIELTEPEGILERYILPFSIFTARNWDQDELFTFMVEVNDIPFYQGHQKVGIRQLKVAVKDILEALYFVDILNHLNTVRYF